MRRTIKGSLVLLSLLALSLAPACGKGKTDDGAKGKEKVAAAAKGDGPNSCHLASKNKCLQWEGANSSVAEVESNCKAFKDGKFVKGACPAEKKSGRCTEEMGPQKNITVFYEGADVGAEEKACAESQGKWEK